MILPEGAYVPADESQAVKGHEFYVEMERRPYHKWRWLCYCQVMDNKVVGQWQTDSPNLCYPSWLLHIKRCKKK